MADNRERDAHRPACGICGEVATTSDGIVGAYLCDRAVCLDAAWDRAFA